MNEKYQAVIDKLDAEKADKPEIRAIEDMLRAVCGGSDAACDRVLAEDKTMAGALEAMRNIAQSRRGKSNCVCIAPDEAERIILEYYGISGDAAPETKATPAEPAKSQTVGNADTVSLFDLI